MRWTKILPLIPVVILLCIAASSSLEASGDSGTGVGIEGAVFNPDTDSVVVSGSASADVVLLQITGGGVDPTPYAFAAVTGGKFSASISVSGYPDGTYAVTVFTSGTDVDRCEVKIERIAKTVGIVGGSSVSVFLGETGSVRFLLTGCTATDIQMSAGDSSIIDLGKMSEDGTVLFIGNRIGSTTIKAVVGDSSATYSVEVKEKPVVQQKRTYTFDIRVTQDYGNLDFGTSGYSESDLRSGITISAEEYNAAAALKAACAASGIPFTMNDDPSHIYYGWIGQMFGLEQYQSPDETVWTYWIQYHNGSYNQFTLGYFTDGGSFTLVWGSTLEDGSSPGGGKKDDKTPAVDAGGSTTTTTTTTGKDEKGNTFTRTETVRVDPDGTATTAITTTTAGKDGGTTGTEIRTVTRVDGTSVGTTTTMTVDKDGNATVRKETREIDSEGRVTGSSVSVSTTTTDSDGSKRTVVTTTAVSSDGSTAESRAETVTRAETDGNGRMTVVSTTTSTAPDGTTGTTGIETSRSERTNADGSRTETVEERTRASDGSSISTSTETTVGRDGSRTVKETVVETDGGGKLVGTTVVESRTSVSGGVTATESTEIRSDADGRVTGSTESTVSTSVSEGVTTTIGRTVVRGADGNTAVTTETVTSRSTASDGSRIVKVSTTETDAASGSTAVTVSERTESKDGSVVTSSITRTEKTASGGRTETDEITVERTGDERTVNRTLTEKASDADGRTTQDTRIEIQETETSSGTIRIERREARAGGPVSTDETVTIGAEDGSVRTCTSVSIVDGRTAKAESSTVIRASGTEVGADIVKVAVEQSSAAMGRTSLPPESISRTFEVESGEGTGAVISSEALGMISGHGAGLRISGSGGSSSISVGSDACGSLSGRSGGPVRLGMRDGVHEELPDAQKGVVGDRFFVVLTAMCGDTRVHELGGTATVTFGYAVPDGTDASRLFISHVDDRGQKTRVESYYDAQAGRFVMTVDHFSVFMVDAESDEPAPQPDPEPADGGSGTGWTAIAVAVVAMVVIAAAVLVIRSRKV